VPNPPPPPEPALGGIDRTFALVALESNHAEIVMAQLALQRSSVDEVRGFAQKMIAEHTALGNALQPGLLRALGASSPPRQLSPSDTLTYRHLQSVSETDFDQEYMQAQIAGHLATLAAFQTEAENGTDARLKALARHWAPTIQSHLQLAVSLTNHVGGASPFKSH